MNDPKIKAREIAFAFAKEAGIAATIPIGLLIDRLTEAGLIAPVDGKDQVARGEGRVKLLWKIRDSLITAITLNARAQAEEVTRLLNTDTNLGDPKLLESISDIAAKIGVKINFEFKEKKDE